MKSQLPKTGFLAASGRIRHLAAITTVIAAALALAVIQPACGAFDKVYKANVTVSGLSNKYYPEAAVPGDYITLSASVDGKDNLYLDYSWDDGDTDTGTFSPKDTSGNGTGSQVRWLVPDPPTGTGNSADSAYRVNYTITVIVSELHTPYSADGTPAHKTYLTQKSVIIPIVPSGTPQDQRAPVADAGADKTVKAGDTVTLDGSGSYSPISEVLTYLWSLASPSGSSASLANTKTVTTTFKADISGSYTATLKVCGVQYCSSDTAVITAQ